MNMKKFTREDVPAMAHPPKSEEVLNSANTDEDNRIACTKEDKPMQTDLKSTLSANDVQYIRNLLAEGVARMLVEKVAKNTAPAVDKSELERYNPTSQKGGTAL